MPGLPSVPAADSIRLNDQGEIEVSLKLVLSNQILNDKKTKKIFCFFSS